jgi:hypothetical protein
MINLGLVDTYMKEHTAELMWEADQVRLVNAALGPGRPLRMRLADWLHTVAKWIEGTPSPDWIEGTPSPDWIEGTPSPDWIEGTPSQPRVRAHA